MKETIFTDHEIVFNLTNIRTGMRVVAEIPFHSTKTLRKTTRDKRSSYSKSSTESPVFFATLLGEQISLNTSQNTSQVV